MEYSSLDNDKNYLLNRNRQNFIDAGENDSSGLGAPLGDQNHYIGLNDGSLDMRMMMRGSITSNDDILGQARLPELANKSSDDLTLDMLGPTTTSQMTLRP
jgi:hypothetical protein